MKSAYQKWVNLSYLAASSLIAYFLFLGLEKLTHLYYLEARIHGIQLIAPYICGLIGALIFITFYRSKVINQFMNEVVTELLRVSWPTPKETALATVVVLIVVVISGFILGIFDYGWTQVMKRIF